MDEFDLSRWSEGIVPAAEGARAAALARQETLTKPSGALGRHEDVSVWLAGVTGQCPPPPIQSPALAIFAGDHGVARTSCSQPKCRGRHPQRPEDSQSSSP